MQLCGVRVELRRGQSAALTLTPKHLQSAVEPLSDCALQRGPLPHGVSAQLGTAGAQQGEDEVIEPMQQQLRLWLDFILECIQMCHL